MTGFLSTVKGKKEGTRARRVPGWALAPRSHGAHFSSVIDAAARLTSALSDRYRIERELGTGGMATYFAINDRQSDIWVAEVSTK